MNEDKVKSDAISAMWAFLQMGGQKSDPRALAELCEQLKHMLMQKTAGQRKDKKTDIPFSELDNITNGIVIEAMALYLSGDLQKLK
jgi:hypothetical protein